jgi:hypothetical protein
MLSRPATGITCISVTIGLAARWMRGISGLLVMTGMRKK